MPTPHESSFAPKRVVIADFPRLDIERVCRVLIRIAHHLEETDHEELSTQEKQQAATTIHGMDTCGVAD